MCMAPDSGSDWDSQTKQHGSGSLESSQNSPGEETEAGGMVGRRQKSWYKELCLLRSHRDSAEGKGQGTVGVQLSALLESG